MFCNRDEIIVISTRQARQTRWHLQTVPRQPTPAKSARKAGLSLLHLHLPWPAFLAAQPASASCRHLRTPNQQIAQPMKRARPKTPISARKWSKRSKTIWQISPPFVLILSRFHQMAAPPRASFTCSARAKCALNITRRRKSCWSQRAVISSIMTKKSTPRPISILMKRPLASFWRKTFRCPKRLKSLITAARPKPFGSSWCANPIRVPAV